MMKQALLLAGLMCVGLAPAYAADIELKAVDKSCWIQIFEDNDFDQNDPHVKIQGPAQMATLKEFSGRNWSDEIQSVIVGPNAVVKAYPDRDFKGTELVLAPNQRVAKLKDLNMGDEIESMKIACGA
ncbi:MAG: hypothetical protein ACREJU_02255 [Nitrospiraceae bacterium]